MGRYPEDASAGDLARRPPERSGGSTAACNLITCQRAERAYF